MFLVRQLPDFFRKLKIIEKRERGDKFIFTATLDAKIAVAAYVFFATFFCAKRK